MDNQEYFRILYVGFFFSSPCAVLYLMFILFPLISIADQSQFWDLNKAADNENIVLAARTPTSETQSWELELVE